MIVSFGDSDTEKIWNGIRVKKIPPEIQNIGRRKLRMLNNSIDLADLRIPITASGLMTNGESFFSGQQAMQLPLKYLIITNTLSAN
jgi:plasmid maintenance system killer protein